MFLFIIFAICSVLGLPGVTFSAPVMLAEKIQTPHEQIFSNLEKLSLIINLPPRVKYNIHEIKEGITGLSALTLARRRGIIALSDEEIVKYVRKQMNIENYGFSVIFFMRQSMLEHATDDELAAITNAAVHYTSALLKIKTDSKLYRDYRLLHHDRELDGVISNALNSDISSEIRAFMGNQANPKILADQIKKLDGLSKDYYKLTFVLYRILTARSRRAIPSITLFQDLSNEIQQNSLLILGQLKL